MIRHHMAIPYRPTMFKDNFHELADLLGIDLIKYNVCKNKKKTTPNHKLQQPKK